MPEAMLVFESQVAIGAIQTWVTCAATWGHSVIWTRNAGEGHVWGLLQLGSVLMSLSPVTMEGRSDVGGLGCHWGHVGI